MPVPENVQESMSNLRADLHGTIFVACDNGLWQARDDLQLLCMWEKMS